MAYVRPGVKVLSSTGAVPGIGTQPGLVVALVGAAPKGPSVPVLVNNKIDLLSIFGDEMNGYSDFAGWQIPEAGRILFENNFGSTPQALVVRAGTTQALIVLTNGGVTTGIWTATALPAALGGTSGAGLTLQYSSVANTFTIIPPAASGLATEIYTGLAVGITWQGIATLVNARSALVNLTLSGADQPALPAITLQTLAGGSDGANPTAAQINAAVDSLAQLTYGQQPIHIIVPLFSDGVATGVTAHALGDVIANTSSPQNQRSQVFGSVATGLTVAQIVTLAGTLVPTENNGDSGRCTLMGNYAPFRTDPLTSSARAYPGWSTACAYAGMCASLPPSSPRGRRFLTNSFTRMAEGFLQTDIDTLLAAGVQTALSNGQLQDQVTTAALTSYRREQSIQAQEDVWAGLLQQVLNTQVIETIAGVRAGLYLDNVVGVNIQGYVENFYMDSAVHTTHQSTSDARSWEVDVTWVPLFPLRNITLRTSLATPAPTAVTNIATFA